MKIAVFSLEQAWEDKASNQNLCRSLFERAAAGDLDLAVFPELTLTGFSMNTALAEPFGDSPSLDFFASLARQSKTACLFGMMTRKGDNVFNSAILLNKNGEFAASYDKIHPFSFSGEEEYYVAGNEPVTAVQDDVRLGISICYDLRFPELYQHLSTESRILFNIACWPKRRVMHWRALLCARAIENQSFMVGVNCVGTDGNGIEYEKSSLVFNPTGIVLEPERSFDGGEVYSIDPAQADESRKSFPMKQDRKPHLYRTFYQ